MLFVITELDVKTNVVNIQYCFGDKKDAVTKLLNIIGSKSDKCVSVINKDGGIQNIKLYSKESGYVYGSSKTLLTMYQIIQIDDTKKKQC